MGKGKQLIAALLVLGALIAAALLLQRDPFEKATKPNLSGVLPNRPEGSIDRIDIESREGAFTVEKRADGWWLVKPKEMRADDGVVQAAVGTLEKMNLVDVISQKKDRQPEYGLVKDYSEYAEVRAHAGGKEVLNLAVGKRTPDQQGSFVRLAANPETVYSTSPALPAVLGRGIQDWRSKVIMNLPVEALDRVKITHAKGSFEAVKDAAGDWQRVGDPAWPLDKAKFGQLLGSFSRLTWVKVLDEPEPGTDYGFNTPAATVSITSDGKDRVLIIGGDAGEPSGATWVQLDGDPRVYQVRKSVTERFTRDFEFYRGEIPSPEKEEPARAQ